MINPKSATLCVAFVVLTALSSFSQIETVVLYNSQPIRVELSENGKIQSFIGLVPGYMDGYDLTVIPMDINPSVIVEPILPTTPRNEGYAVVSSERIELYYKSNYATLDKITIDKLDEIVSKLKIDPSIKILVTAHNETQESDKLSSNRFAATIAYLGIKGISPDRIQTEIQKSDTLVDVIAINYMN